MRGIFSKAASIKILAIATVFLVGNAHAAKLPPVEAFGQIPYMQHVQISPDGTHLAAIQERNGEKVLTVYDLRGTPGKNVVGMTFDTKKKVEEEIRYFFWPNNERLIVVTEFPSMRFGEKNMETRMASISRNLQDQRQVPKQKRGIKTPVQFQSRIIDRLPDDPDHMLVAFNRDPSSAALDAFKMNVADGGLTKILNGDGRVMSYKADKMGNIRMRRYYNKTTREGDFQYRAQGEKKWNEIFAATGGKGGEERERAMWPLMFTDNPDRMYVTHANEQGRKALGVFDFVSNTIVRKVFSNKTWDVAYYATDPFTGKLVGAKYFADLLMTEYFDDAFSEIQRTAEQSFPDSVSEITSRDKAGDKWIVRIGGDRRPGAFYLYTASQNKFVQVGLSYPQLKGVSLRPTTPVAYKARDGLEIHGYLTEPSTPAPHKLVVMPHAGPRWRATRAFDYEVQFLASRGYAVFQPNFRGSYGYGIAFEKAGHKEWGLKMQDDVTDGVSYLVEQGLADPEKMCIVGQGYGGYSALMGAVRTPDRYQCAASFAGATDLRRKIREDGRGRFIGGNYTSLGDRFRNKARLIETSPIDNVDKIKIPILLVHGKNDRVVPFEQSARMHNAMKKAGKHSDYVQLKNGDHHLSRGSNRILYLKKLEAFLERHIGD